MMAVNVSGDVNLAGGMNEEVVNGVGEGGSMTVRCQCKGLKM